MSDAGPGEARARGLAPLVGFALGALLGLAFGALHTSAQESTRRRLAKAARLIRAARARSWARSGRDAEALAPGPDSPIDDALSRTPTRAF